MKLDNYFNRQFTDHISTQNGYLENDDEHVGVAGLPKKWIWTFPDDASRMSMGIIRMPQNDPMMARPHGNPLLSLGEMAEWNREATVRPGGLIEWRMMGHTMVPLAQAAISGLSHDSMASTRMPGMPRLHRMLQSRRRRPRQWPPGMAPRLSSPRSRRP